MMMKKACSLVVLLVFVGLALGAGRMSSSRTYPAFQLGVTGVWVQIKPGSVVEVTQVDPGTPAQGKLQAGDKLILINGMAIEGDDPRVPLGQAITQAERTNGLVRFSLERSGQKRQTAVKIPMMGAYGNNWPLDCRKSSKIVDDHARHLAQLQNTQGWFGDRGRGGLQQCMAALFLLSTDNPEYKDNVKAFAHALAAMTENKPSGSSWHMGYHLIFLCEYYLKTGDERVLAAIQSACALAAENQTVGGWGHYMRTVSVGYVQSGLMNSAGVTLFLGMTLARECGITVHEEAYQRALLFFYRNVGHGSICYGDHRAEIYADTNGRNAAIACALGLLDQEPFQSGAEHLAAMVAESYYAFEFGHTGGGFNVLWRGIALSQLPDGMGDLKRQHMQELAWYYDVCRLPQGGFSMLPSPPDTTRYTGEAWGQGLGLTYTAPRKTLRITGAPRTKHSKKTPRIKTPIWGNAQDDQFLSIEHAAGYVDSKEKPHEIYAKVTGKEQPSARYCANLLRHFNPVIRTFAGRKLAAINTDEAHDAIEAALKHEDPRVRRAAYDTLSGYENWSRRGTVSRVPVDVISKRYVPYIEAALASPSTAWWEVDGALWALSTAKPEDIRRNKKHIQRFAEHDEWYLRESAYWALVGLGPAITGEEFLELGRMFNRAERVFERSSYDGGIGYLIKRRRVQLEPEIVSQYTQMIATQLYEAAIGQGYDEMAARHEAAHRVMMVLKQFPNPPYHLIARDLTKYMDGWTPDYQHSGWLITGSKWQPGLVQISEKIGKDAEPIIRKFEHCLKQDYWKAKDKNHQAIREAMTKAIAAFNAIE